MKLQDVILSTDLSDLDKLVFAYVWSIKQKGGKVNERIVKKKSGLPLKEIKVSFDIFLRKGLLSKEGSFFVLVDEETEEKPSPDPSVWLTPKPDLPVKAPQMPVESLTVHQLVVAYRSAYIKRFKTKAPRDQKDYIRMQKLKRKFGSERVLEFLQRFYSRKDIFPSATSFKVFLEMNKKEDE